MHLTKVNCEHKFETKKITETQVLLKEKQEDRIRKLCFMVTQNNASSTTLQSDLCSKPLTTR